MIGFLEIWEVDLGDENIEGHEQKGFRPFIVISRNTYHNKSKTPIGFVLTLSNHKLDSKYSLQIENDFGVKVAVLITQIRTLSDKRFKKKWKTKLGITEFQKLMELFLKEIVGSKNINIELNDISNILSEHFK